MKWSEIRETPYTILILQVALAISEILCIVNWNFWNKFRKDNFHFCRKVDWNRSFIVSRHFSWKFQENLYCQMDSARPHLAQ
jgi:hypothetical protein